MTKKEKREEKKYLQNDIQAMMDQLGSESAIKNITGTTNKKVEKAGKEIELAEVPQKKQIESKTKVNFS